MHPDLQQAAAQYEELLKRVFCDGDLSAAEHTRSLPNIPELEAQGLWMSGLLGKEGNSMRHGCVRIIDFGEWNRSVGPDFLRAEIEINGERLRGDIELDPTAQDWEHHGHGANPAYNNVILHVVLSPPPTGWYTRDSLHRDIPILPIDPRLLSAATGKPRMAHAEPTELCREPLNALPADKIATLLQAAAGYRILRKRRLFRIKAQHIGIHQAWYEALAETLGYKVNKQPMLMLARRAPLHALGKQAEPILFGTAGFLFPVLPEQATPDTRHYHRSVWDAWWSLRSEYELSEGRSVHWQFAPLRPGNHPHRRVAALAVAAQHWRHIEPLLNAERAEALVKKLTSLSHPYWDTHYTLASATQGKRTALIGASRARDFLINHVYVQDESAAAWETYLRLKEKDTPSAVRNTAAHLFGERSDLKDLLNFAYAQQGLLQIEADYCSTHACCDCCFPAKLREACSC